MKPTFSLVRGIVWCMVALAVALGFLMAFLQAARSASPAPQPSPTVAEWHQTAAGPLWVIRSSIYTREQAQEYADFVGTLSHGWEFSDTQLYVASPTDLAKLCAVPTACYKPKRGRVVVPGPDETTVYAAQAGVDLGLARVRAVWESCQDNVRCYQEWRADPEKRSRLKSRTYDLLSNGNYYPNKQIENGFSIWALIAHEYGHRVQFCRNNWRKAESYYGPRHWGSYVRSWKPPFIHPIEAVFGGSYYALPGEAFAQSFAAMHFSPLKIWYPYAGEYPDSGAFAAIQRDIYWYQPSQKKRRAGCHRH